MSVGTATRVPLRLHLSESVHGASPAALAAAHAALDDLPLYPDPGRLAPVEAFAAHWRVDPDRIAVANGSDELVLLASIALGRPDVPGLTTAGTFPGYAICLRTVGRGVTEVPLRGTRLDVDAFVEALPRAGVAFVCNAHNPTGQALTRAEFDVLVEQAGRCGVPVVFDEAYLEFAPPGTPQVRDYLDSGAPVLAFRTFSKAYGLAGVRIGYAVGDRALVAALRTAQGTMPFSVNRVAQAAAVAALADQEFLDRVRDATAEVRDWFTARLAADGRSVLPSVTNFVAVAVGDSAAVEAGLARQGILTRDAGRFGLPGFLRVSLRSRADLTEFIHALRSWEDVRPQA